jgi:hypothetical protein
MVLHLDSRAERLIEEQLHTGRVPSPEEVVARALESMASGVEGEAQTDPNQAVDALFALREKHKLSLGDGYSVTELVRESRNID